MDEKKKRYMITPFKIKHWDQHLNAQVLRPSSHISGYAHTFPPGYRNI